MCNTLPETESAWARVVSLLPCVADLEAAAGDKSWIAKAVTSHYASNTMRHEALPKQLLLLLLLHFNEYHHTFGYLVLTLLVPQSRFGDKLLQN